MNWCDSAYYVAVEKVVLVFLYLKWLGLAVMVEYHSKLLMLSNLAFQMKFKYTSLLVNSLYYLPLGRRTSKNSRASIQSEARNAIKLEEPNRSMEKISVTAFHCCVPCCTNDSRYDEERTLSFHKFPKNLTRKINNGFLKIRRHLGIKFKVSWKHVDCSLYI